LAENHSLINKETPDDHERIRMPTRSAGMWRSPIKGRSIEPMEPKLFQEFRLKSVEKSLKKSCKRLRLWLVSHCLFLEQSCMSEALAPGAPEGRAGRW
jgi:hypothetical protein